MIIDNHNTECVMCPCCSGVWSLLYAPIVVGYVECVMCPYCSGVFGVFIKHNIKVCYMPLL